MSKRTKTPVCNRLLRRVPGRDEIRTRSFCYVLPLDSLYRLNDANAFTGDVRTCLEDMRPGNRRLVSLLVERLTDGTTEEN